MAEPETIRLDRSGLVLPRHPTQHPRWQLRTGDHEFIVEQTFIDGSRWYAGSCFVAGDQTRYCNGHYGTEAECLAWLDARVLELRAALLPPGAIVVADTEETVERIARALAGKVRPLDQMSNWAQIRYRVDAATVLTALREAGK